jgi:hypothetical protein
MEGGAMLKLLEAASSGAARAAATTGLRRLMDTYG